MMTMIYNFIFSLAISITFDTSPIRVGGVVEVCRPSKRLYPIKLCGNMHYV